MKSALPSVGGTVGDSVGDSDSVACAAAARLRFAFRTHGEAIVHGDLHTGSVMATVTDTRVIDPEFACAGPMAFDTGKMLGNLALSAIAHRALGNDRYARVVDGYAAQFWLAFVDEASRLWPSHEPWRERFLADLLDESARFAGAVMCRRIVGLAGVSDIRDIADDGVRLRAQRAALVGGAALLRSSRGVTLDALWALAVGAQ